MDHKLKDGKSIESVDPKKDYEFETCVPPSSENEKEFTIPKYDTSNRLEIKPGMYCCYVFPHSRIHSPHHLH